LATSAGAAVASCDDDDLKTAEAAFSLDFSDQKYFKGKIGSESGNGSPCG